MTDRSLVSYIIPCLNELEHIGRLIEGIIDQEYRPIEILVVDGGSRDGTRDAVQRLIPEADAAGVALRLLSESDHGLLRSPANARNIGIRASTGEVCLLLDADFYMVDRGFTAKVARHLTAAEQSVSVKLEFHPKTRLEQYLAAVAVPFATVAFQRELLEEHPFDPRLGYGEDEHFWLRAGVVPERVLEEARLGRHEPATWREVWQQQRWYGRTMPKFLIVTRAILDKAGRRTLYRRHIWVRVPRHAFFVGAPILALASLPIHWLLSATVTSLYLIVLLKNWAYLPARGRVRRSFAWMTAVITVQSAGYIWGLLLGLMEQARGKGNPSRD